MSRQQQHGQLEHHLLLHKQLHEQLQQARERTQLRLGVFLYAW